MWSHAVVVIEHLWHHPLLLAFRTCGDTLDSGNELPLGIGTARDGLLRGRIASWGSRALSRALKDTAC